SGMEDTSSEATGALIWALGGPDPADRRRATASLFTRVGRSRASAGGLMDGLRSVLLDEWEALGPRSPLLVAPLALAFREEPSLMTLEMIAMALVLQGEDGATELLPYLASGEFALQHKAAVAFGLLDRSGRWAVGAILRALE